MLSINSRLQLDVQEPSASSAITITPSPEKFADETPQQQYAHREIEERYRKSKRPKPVPLARVRKWDMQRLFRHRYGARLPDDEAGEADLRLMAQNLALLGEGYIADWASVWAPWLTDAKLAALIQEVGPGTLLTADALGEELNLYDAERTMLRIRSIGGIDCPKAQRRKRRRNLKIILTSAKVQDRVSTRA